ncbi:MAG: glutamyl-tRNA reductase [Planctomycetota bacterium]
MNLSVLGISHHTAPVEVRETLALPDASARALLRTIRAEPVLNEALVLDTCNRTELYCVAAGAADPRAYLLERIAAVKGAAPDGAVDRLYRHHGTSAVRHLFRVAAGLDSQVIGEHQILAQTKAAYRQALNERTAGFLLNRLMHRAFRVGKRVRSDTRLAEGAGGVPQAAAATAAEHLGDLAGRAVVIVGAGETAERAGRALIARGADRLTVANRSRDRARRLAERLGDDEEVIRCPARLRRHGGRAPVRVDAAGLDGLAALAREADLLVTATASPEPLLTRTMLAGRADRPLTIIDLGVPRNVAADAAAAPGVRLINIDALDRRLDEAARQREADLARAERIVDDAVADFDAWLASRQAAPTIALLRRRLDALRERELARYGHRFDETHREDLDRFTETLLNKLLHDPIRHLHRLARDGDTPESLAAADLVRRLFDLDATEGER